MPAGFFENSLFMPQLERTNPYEYGILIKKMKGGFPMPKEKIPFTAFTDAAGPPHREFIEWMHRYMTERGCEVDIKDAKSGFVVSYVHKPKNRTVANYVFRKKGPMLRLYADHIPAYMEALEKWPAPMQKAVQKAGPCKRMLNPEACNSRCLMGYDFILNGERQQKCRYNCFMFLLGDETNPYLKEMVQHEMEIRTGNIA